MATNKGKYVFNSEKSESIQISDDVKISTVTTIDNFKIFFDVAKKIYEKNEYWISPFWSEIKGFFKSKELYWTHSETKLFVAYKKDKAVGRIATFIDDSYVAAEKKKVGFFGFFECINDYKIASALFGVAEKWLKSKAMQYMHGPINGRADVGSGFVIEGFNHLPYLLGHYSHPYYVDFVEKYGLRKSKDLVSYEIDLTKPIPPKVKETAERCEAGGIKIRPFNRFKFKSEMDWWLKMFMEEFSDHWGYTDIGLNEVKSRFGIKQLRWILDPGLFLVAEDNGKPIGFRWSFPGYNQIFKDLNGKLGVIGSLKVLLNRHKINRGRFIVMGIKKEYRGRGIGTCMNYHNLVEMKKRGYKTAEYGWIVEDNIASCKAGEKIGGKLYKKYRVYEKKI